MLNLKHNNFKYISEFHATNANVAPLHNALHNASNANVDANVALLLLALLSLCLCLTPRPVHADERYFTYSYQADVLPQGEAEFEQSVTNQSGKETGDYTEWNFRSELEYGLTSRLMTALYLNWTNINQDGVSGEPDQNTTKFKGVSSEWIYQLLNPNLSPLGLALYAEYTTDGDDQELEGKILLSKRLDKWELALNGAFEGESQGEADEREREATLTFSAGAAYRITPNWLTGLEVRNTSAYPGGLDLNGQEYQTWSVGPCLHYGSPDWWANLTILPQVWGNGDGSNNDRQLVHQESLEARLIIGFEL